MDIQSVLAQEFSLQPAHVKNIIGLLDDGCTIPFIARYRKELTGSCDDQVLRALDDRLKYLRSLDKRRSEVENLINEQGKLTPEIVASLQNSVTLTEIEDIYRPFRPKRKTRASVAISKGLQGLADFILKQSGADINLEAQKYVNAENRYFLWKAISLYLINNPPLKRQFYFSRWHL